MYCSKISGVGMERLHTLAMQQRAQNRKIVYNEPRLWSLSLLLLAVGEPFVQLSVKQGLFI